MSFEPLELDPLGAPLRALFADLAHAGQFAPDEPTARGEAGREQRGTRVRFELKLEPQGALGVRYRAYGCPSTLATCEWLARRLEAATAPGPGQARPGEAAAALGGPADWAQHLKIAPQKLGRLLIVEDALRLAFSGLPQGA